MLTLGWLVSVAQQEIIYGTPRADGYDKITKGAFWSTRPEAKMVEEGSIPPGCTVDVLTEQYYVRFIDTEHNQNDDNYIIFPVGAKIYTKGGKYYSAKCGNEIEYLRPVNMVKIVEKPVEKIVEVEKPAPKPETEKPVVVRDTVYQQTTVVEETRYEDDVYYRPRPMIDYSWIVRPILNNGCYGRPMIVDNRTYVNNYQNNSNYYCKRTNSQPTPTPTPTDNHRYMGGGRGNDNYTTGEGGGRGSDTYNTGEGGGRGSDSYTTGQGGGRSASVTRDGMGRVTNSQVSSVNNRRVDTNNNPTTGMVSSRNTNYSSGSNVNVRLANRISSGTSYNPGVRRTPSMQSQNRSLNSYTSQRSSRPSGGNGLMSSPVGRR